MWVACLWSEFTRVNALCDRPVDHHPSRTSNDHRPALTVPIWAPKVVHVGNTGTPNPTHPIPRTKDRKK
nr:MAG TPA: hypothetical protein [Caudoviricetes sp.]